MSQDRPFVWKSLWKGLGGLSSWVGQCLRESLGQENSVSWVEGDSDTVSASFVGGPEKEQ